MSAVSFNVKTVVGELANFRLKILQGPDGTPPTDFVTSGLDLPSLLLNLFTISITSGVFPIKWIVLCMIRLIIVLLTT